jgi:integrative and conjugative element protein (TIGR02256 family)
MDNLIVTDEGNVFKISISQSLMNEIHRLCETSLPNETGGILLGSYTENSTCASVSKLLKAPSDSMSGPTWFFRGTKGVKSKLDKLWKQKKQYYLGEWHYHPNSSSNISSQDINQMNTISNDKAYKCPEPILLIIGGSPFSWECSTYVFLKGKDFLQLR